MTDAKAVVEDPLFKDPYIDINELRTDPVPHRYVHGGFKGTQARFSFYFPPAETYQGRFHHNTYPLCVSEDIGPFPIDFEVSTGNLGFTLDSGAYYVQTNMGGAFRAADPTLAAYRVNAAAAQYSRVVAAELYGKHRPYGYLYGGSGGAYQSIGAAEHTQDVWDGFMPFVLGCNNAVPSLWSVRLNALRVLGRRNKFAGVIDALNPGGSGDIYAGLDDEERAALLEATRMGYPPRAWFNHEDLRRGYFSDVFGVVPAMDPSYAEDFWSKPGYLGSDPSASVHESRFAFETTVTRVLETDLVEVELAETNGRDLECAHLTFLTGAAAGRTLHVSRVRESIVGFASTSSPDALAGLHSGDKVRLDNSWILAAQTYQRHQVPPDDSEYGWNQFRDAQGKPLYPQRDILIGHWFALNSVGSLLTGNIKGKMLLVQNLMDIDAFGWCADWYRSEVRRELGAASDESFALWFVDNAQHDNPKSDLTRAHTVGFDGVLQQGLRDLADWVECGIRPRETTYAMREALVDIPAAAGDRGGIQPVVELTVNGGARTEVGVGEAITLEATAEVPTGMGKIVSAEWDFEGEGSFPATAEIGAPDAVLRLSASHAYDKPGTYFPVIRVASHRAGDVTTPYSRVQNLARARVVVA